MAFANRAKRFMGTMGIVVASGALMVPLAQANTPWGLVASRVIGHVRQLSQKPTGNQPGFDVATVILNADATKVYATAINLLRKNQALHVVAADQMSRTVEFSDGVRSARITVIDLGTRASQILVASAIKPGEATATPRIVTGILNICQAMKATCGAQ